MARRGSGTCPSPTVVALRDARPVAFLSARWPHGSPPGLPTVPCGSGMPNRCGADRPRAVEDSVASLASLPTVGGSSTGGDDGTVRLWDGGSGPSAFRASGDTSVASIRWPSRPTGGGWPPPAETAGAALGREPGELMPSGYRQAISAPWRLLGWPAAGRGRSPTDVRDRTRTPVTSCTPSESQQVRLRLRKPLPTAGGWPAVATTAPVRLWEAERGVELLTLRGHTGRGPVRSISRRMAGAWPSVGDDGTYPALGCGTGRELLILRGREGSAVSAGWPSAQRPASGLLLATAACGSGRIPGR